MQNNGAAQLSLNTSEIILWEPGFYYIYYSISNQLPAQFSIFKNNTLVLGTITGSLTQNTSSAIVNISASDVTFFATGFSPTGFSAVLQITNHTSTVPIVVVNGQVNSGSAAPQVTATITVLKIA